MTEETLSEETKVKDELGRVQRQIEQELKNQLKDYSSPLDEVKAWVNNVLDPIKTLQTDIKNQIKEVEEKATEARKETVKEAKRNKRQERQTVQTVVQKPDAPKLDEDVQEEEGPGMQMGM